MAVLKPLEFVSVMLASQQFEVRNFKFSVLQRAAAGRPGKPKSVIFPLQPMTGREHWPLRVVDIRGRKNSGHSASTSTASLYIDTTT